MDNPVAHKVVGNLAVVVHMVEMDTVVVVGYMVGLDTAAGYTVVLSIVTGYTVGMDTVDRALTVVDIVVEDWGTDLTLLERMKVGRIDLLYLLMYCHSHRKTGHSLHFVYHNFRSTLLHFVELQEHAHHDRIEYKMWYLLEFEHDMQDKQSLRGRLPELSLRHHNACKSLRLVLLLRDNLGRQSDSDRLPSACHRPVQQFHNQDKIFSR